MAQLHVICTSVGNQAFHSVYVALKRRGNISVTGIDSDPLATGIHIADAGRSCPPRSQGEELLDVVTALIQTQKTNILLPLSTEDQGFYSLHRSRLSNSGLQVIVASETALQIANNKHHAVEFANKLGIPVPDYVFVDSLVALRRVVNRCVADGVKCVIKRQYGTGFQSVKVIDPFLDQKSDFWSRTKTTLHPAELLRWIEEFGLDETLMVTEYLPNQHYSVDAVLTSQDDFLACVRTENRHWFGFGIRGEVIEYPDLIIQSHKLARAIDLRGPMNIEFKCDNSGVPRLIDINPRFGASIGHTISAGMNLPLALVQSEIGEQYSMTSPTFGSSYIPLLSDVQLLNT